MSSTNGDIVSTERGAAIVEAALVLGILIFAVILGFSLMGPKYSQASLNIKINRALQVLSNQPDVAILEFSEEEGKKILANDTSLVRNSLWQYSDKAAYLTGRSIRFCAALLRADGSAACSSGVLDRSALAIVEEVLNGDTQPATRMSGDGVSVTANGAEPCDSTFARPGSCDDLFRRSVIVDCSAPNPADPQALPSERQAWGVVVFPMIDASNPVSTLCGVYMARAGGNPPTWKMPVPTPTPVKLSN